MKQSHKYILGTLLLGAAALGSMYVLHAPSKPLDFAHCHGNAYCLLTTARQMRTLADYQAYIAVEELPFMHTLHIELLDILWPADRQTLTQADCDALQFPVLQQICTYALAAKQADTDCANEPEQKSYDYTQDGVTVTVKTEPRAQCIREEILANTRTDCSSVPEEYENWCHFALAAHTKTATLCSAIVDANPSWDAQSCTMAVHIASTNTIDIAHCNGSTKCIENLRTILVSQTPIVPHTCSSDDEEYVEACNDLFAYYNALATNSVATCPDQSCISDVNSKIVYTDNTPPDAITIFSALEDEDIRNDALEDYQTAYAMFNSDPKWCSDSICFFALRAHLPLDEQFCTTLPGVTSDTDTRTSDCQQVQFAMLSFTKQDASYCQDSFWCLKNLYTIAEKEQQFVVATCDTIQDESYKKQECTQFMTKNRAIQTKDATLCTTASCIESVLKARDFATDTCTSITDETLRHHCEDAAQIAAHKDTFTVSHCATMHNAKACIDDFFTGVKEGTFTASEPTVCTGLAADVQLYCYQKHAMLLGDIAGCTTEDCLEAITETHSITSAQCASIGTWVTTDTEPEQLRSMCLEYLKNHEAKRTNTLAACTTNTCIDATLRALQKGEFTTEYIRSLPLPKEHVKSLFVDAFEDAIDIEAYTNSSIYLTGTMADALQKPELAQMTPEQKQVVQDLYAKIEPKNIVDSCKKIPATLLNVFKKPLQLECEQEAADMLAAQTQDFTVCGTLECVKDIRANALTSSDCTKLRSYYTDTFHDDLLVDDCKALFAR